jgi:hypothetical protein
MRVYIFSSSFASFCEAWEDVLDISSTYTASQSNTNLQPLLPHTVFSYHPSHLVIFQSRESILELCSVGVNSLRPCEKEPFFRICNSPHGRRKELKDTIAC